MPSWKIVELVKEELVSIFSMEKNDLLLQHLDFVAVVDVDSPLLLNFFDDSNSCIQPKHRFHLKTIYKSRNHSCLFLKESQLLLLHRVVKKLKEEFQQQNIFSKERKSHDLLLRLLQSVVFDFCCCCCLWRLKNSKQERFLISEEEIQSLEKR